MSRDSGGTYTLPLPPVVADDTIDASWANTTMADMVTAMSDSLSRSGKGGMSAALKVTDGTVSAPGLAFTSAANTGIYRAGSGDVRMSVGGADLMRWTTANGTQIWDGAAWTTISEAGGKQTIWVPAAAMRPTVSNGCAAITGVETTAGRPDMTVLDFDTTADEHAQFQVAFPKSWNLGTVTFQVFWTTTATGTTGVAWGLQGVACSDADTIDVAYGTAVVVTDDAQTAAEDLYVTAESSAVTIAGTPADADICFFRVFRDVSDANDDMTEDARLIGIKLFYTTDAETDA